MQQAGRSTPHQQRPKAAKAGKKAKGSKANQDPKSDQPQLSPEEQAQKERAAAAARKIFIGFVTPLVGIAILLGAIGFFAAGPKIAVALGGATLAFSLSYRYPRQALWFFFLYMPFSGTVTYWLAGGNAIFQLAKDAFYFPAMLALIMAASKEKKDFWNPRKVMPWMLVLLVTCILGLLFVNLPRQFLPNCTESAKLLGRACADGKPFPQGLLGLKVFMGYVPLIFCMQALIKSRQEFIFFVRSHVVLAVVCAGLSLMQLMMLKTGRCAGTDHLEGDALFKATLGAKCLVGGSLVYSPSQGMIRLPGTFVAPWQWGWFLISNAYFTFAASFFDNKLIWRLLGFLGMAIVFVSALISGQRIALALVPVCVIILIALLLVTRLLDFKRFIPIIGALGALIFGGLIVYADVVQERLDSFISRWQASPPGDIIAHQFDFIMPLIDGKPFGNGLGSATNSARMFGPTLLVETWFPKIMYETGLIGVLAFLLFVSALSWFTFSAYRQVKDRNLKGFALCFWIFVVFISYQTYYYPLDVDPVAVYYWSIVGVLLRLPAIEKAERLAAATATTEAEVTAPPPRFTPVRSHSGLPKESFGKPANASHSSSPKESPS